MPPRDGVGAHGCRCGHRGVHDARLLLLHQGLGRQSGQGLLPGLRNHGSSLHHLRYRVRHRLPSARRQEVPRAPAQVDVSLDVVRLPMPCSYDRDHGRRRRQLPQHHMQGAGRASRSFACRRHVGRIQAEHAGSQVLSEVAQSHFRPGGLLHLSQLVRRPCRQMGCGSGDAQGVQGKERP